MRVRRNGGTSTNPKRSLTQRRNLSLLAASPMNTEELSTLSPVYSKAHQQETVYKDPARVSPDLDAVPGLLSTRRPLFTFRMTTHNHRLTSCTPTTWRLGGCSKRQAGTRALLKSLRPTRQMLDPRPRRKACTRPGLQHMIYALCVLRRVRHHLREQSQTEACRSSCESSLARLRNRSPQALQIHQSPQQQRMSQHSRDQTQQHSKQEAE